MSLSYAADQTVKVLDVRLAASNQNQTVVAVPQGPSVTLYKSIPGQNPTDAGVNFQLDNIADTTARDSRIDLEATVYVTFTVANTTATPTPLITSDNFGWRNRPLGRCMDSLQHTVNQATYTARLNDLLPELDRINQDAIDLNFYDNTSSDLIDNYANATGSNLTPLGPYTKTIAGDGVTKPRSNQFTIFSGNNVIAADASNQQVVIQGKLWEPLVSPFCNIAKKDARGLYAITAETIQISWSTDLTQMIAFYKSSPNLTINNVKVSFIPPGGSQGVINCRVAYLTPYQHTQKDIPTESIYPFTDFQTRFTTPLPVIPAGTSYTFSTGVATFSNTPDLVLMYPKVSAQFLGCNATTGYTSRADSYLQIQNAQFSYDNGNPVLSAATADQLFEICQRNGLNIPRQCFLQNPLNYSAFLGSQGSTPLVYGCGGMLLLSPALDFSVRPGVSSSSAGRFILDGTSITLRNNTGTDWPGGNWYIVPLSSAVLKRLGNQYQYGLLSTPVDVLLHDKSMPRMDQIEYQQARTSDGFLSAGAGIGSLFKKLVSKAAPALHKAIAYAAENPEVIQQGLKAIKSATGGRRMRGGGAAFAPALRPSNMRPQKPKAFYDYTYKSGQNPEYYETDDQELW